MDHALFNNLTKSNKKPIICYLIVFSSSSLILNKKMQLLISIINKLFKYIYKTIIATNYDYYVVTFDLIVLKFYFIKVKKKAENKETFCFC